MQKVYKVIEFLFIVFLSITFGVVNVFSQFSQQQEAEEYEVAAPHFIITSGDSDTERFPLLKTDVNVNIAGVIADVSVVQTYKNEGSKPIEAIYVFPSSTGASVYAMEMTIGTRTIKADLKENAEARQIYDEAKDEGRSASLLEQLNPNIFKMNVANILPGDIIKVELKYTEMIKPVNKIYEFVFPTLVGPRYESDERKEKSNGLQTGYTQTQEPSYDFDINVHLQTGISIAELECISHKVKTEAVSENEAVIKLDESESKSGNKDFILKYKLAGDKIETGLLLSDNGDEKFFALIVQPPDKPSPKDIPAREYIFVMDISGSMQGIPLTVSKKLMINLLKSLRDTDKFNVIQFSGSANILSEKSLPVNQENIEKAVQTIANISGGGGTEIINALNKIDDIPKDEKVSRTVVIVTDGFVRVEREVFDFIRDRLDRMNVFAFGIGKNVNRYIIEGIANVGLGEPSIITDFKEADYEAKRFEKYIASPVLTDIEVEYNSFLAFDTEPKKIPDVFADRPIIIHGKWDNDPTGFIKLKGVKGVETLYLDIEVERFATFVNSDALKYLWARNKLRLLSDYETLEGKESHKSEIVQLGLKYNLLTDYTSFVAVDSEVRTSDSAETVAQPLPNPPEGFRGSYSNSNISVLSQMSSHSYQAGGKIGGSMHNMEVELLDSDSRNGMNDNLTDGSDGADNPFQDNAIRIIENFECMDILKSMKNIYVSVMIDMNANNEINNMKVIKSTLPDCNDEIYSAIRSFVEDYEDTIPKMQYRVELVFEKPDKIDYVFQGKKYTLIRNDEYYYAEIKDGYGQKIKLGDNIAIEYEIYNMNRTLIDNQELEFMAGINEAAFAIDELVTGAKKQGELLLFITPHQLMNGKPYIPVREFTGNMIIKIKITEHEIE